MFLICYYSTVKIPKRKVIIDLWEIVQFFPQMKPEVWGKQGPELTDNEKVIFDILSKERSMDLGALKEQAGLSNKQWDKSMKGLAKHGLTKVTKTDDNLIVDLVE